MDTPRGPCDLCAHRVAAEECRSLCRQTNLGLSPGWAASDKPGLIHPNVGKPGWLRCPRYLEATE